LKSALNQATAANQASALLGSSGSRRLLMRNGAARTSRLGTGRAPASTPADAAQLAAESQAAVRTSGNDKRSLEELVRYVNGDKSSGGGTPKKKQTNPKRRQQRAGA